MAMTILNIGILATVAAFNSGIVTLHRSGMISTASVLADKQVELYRSLTYGSIALDSSSIPATTPYTSDAAWSSSPVTTTCTTPLPPECNASRTVTGPDHHSYRIDTYIHAEYPNGGDEVATVFVVVRNGATPAQILARSASTFWRISIAATILAAGS